MPACTLIVFSGLRQPAPGWHTFDLHSVLLVPQAMMVYDPARLLKIPLCGALLLVLVCGHDQSVQCLLAL